jgi:hypothetical protein
MQVNQAIEANMVRPELPEEADRVEQLMVEFRHVPYNQDYREAVLWIRIRKFLGTPGSGSVIICMNPDLDLDLDLDSDPSIIKHIK